MSGFGWPGVVLSRLAGPITDASITVDRATSGPAVSLASTGSACGSAAEAPLTVTRAAVAVSVTCYGEVAGVSP